MNRCAAAAGLGAAFALILLAACTTTPTLTSVPLPWPERRTVLQADSAFTLVGRVAITSASDGVNASLRWTQDGERARVTLDGPLGVGGAEIDFDGDRLDLTTSKGVHLEGEAAQAELQRRIGFPLPLAALRYWVRGVPSPAIEAQEDIDESAQRLRSLTQDGWQIDYTSYLDAPDGALPRKLTAQRSDTRVRVVVDRWEP